MKRIIIDAGHGGSDSGAIGFGVMEKDWNLKMSLYQYRRLTELGAKVSLTRTTDETLESFNRVSRIKDQYDYCISNHWNAFNGQARGIETIHSYLANPRFAKRLAQQIVKDSNLPLRRVFSRKTTNNRSDYYFMHRLTGTTQTIIIEYGFIDHVEDHAFYSNEANFYKVAEGVIKVICDQIGVKYTKSTRSSKLSNPKSNNSSNDISIHNKRLVSIHPGKLRFYKKPSWSDKAVYGYLNKGIGFPEVTKQVKVGSGYQYEVKNSKGELFYITASPRYIKLITK